MNGVDLKNKTNLKVLVIGGAGLHCHGLDYVGLRYMNVYGPR